MNLFPGQKVPAFENELRERGDAIQRPLTDEVLDAHEQAIRQVRDIAIELAKKYF